MLAHRIETTIKADGTVILENLPFHAGDTVEVIVLSCPRKLSEQNRYFLRGTPIQYNDPTESVAQEAYFI